MARCVGVDKRHGGAGAVGAVRRVILAAVQRERLREGLVPGVKRRGARRQGLFREVRLAVMSPTASAEVGQGVAHPGHGRGLCAVLPGGLRIEGLDVSGAVALARLLG